MTPRAMMSYNFESPRKPLKPIELLMLHVHPSDLLTYAQGNGPWAKTENDTYAPVWLQCRSPQVINRHGGEGVGGWTHNKWRINDG